MAITPAIAHVALVMDAHGVIRVLGSRVTLDTVVTAFRAEATAEEIVQQFPTLALADVYQVIAYYLKNTAEVDVYLSTRQKKAEFIRQEIEKCFDPRDLRTRLVARKTASAS